MATSFPRRGRPGFRPTSALAWLWLLAATAARAEAPVADRVARAEAILGAMTRGAFAEVVASFDATMAAALPVSKLEEAWSGVVGQGGELQSIDERRAEESGGLLRVDLVCSFARGPLVVRVVLDAEDRVAGLWFKPAGEAPATAPEPPPAGVVEVPVTVGDDPWKLGGVLAIPERADEAHRVPAALLLAGSGPQDRDETIGPNRPLRDIAWGLAARGIATLRYDKRTHTHGTRMEATATVEEEVLLDAAAGLALLRRRPEVDAARISCIGHSLGGTLAPLVAAKDGKLASIVLLAGSARPLDEVVRDQIETLLSMGPEATGSSPEALRGVLAELDRFATGKEPGDAVLGMTRRYLEDLERRDPVGVARTLPIPVLVMQGGRDYQVTRADMGLWMAALPRERATLRYYDDLSHLFMTGTGRATPMEYVLPGRVADVVVDDIAAFLAKRR